MIRLVLVATSRICFNNEIVGIKLTEIKENVTHSLKEILANVTTTKVDRSIFNIQHKTQGKSEIQVTHVAIICAICYHSVYMIFTRLFGYCI